MPSARDLERLLIRSGMSASRLDTVNRQLRDTGDVPTAGRGLYAAPIAAGDAAAILIGYAGAGKAIRAGERLRKLRDLRSGTDGRSLFAVLRSLLEEPGEVQQLRISRIRRRAKIILFDGREIVFAPTDAKAVTGRFENESVLDGRLLNAVAALLRGEDQPLSAPDEAEDSE